MQHLDTNDLTMLRETVRRFVGEELIPLEPIFIRRDAERGFSDMPLVPPEKEAQLQRKASELGLWGLDVPEELGGQGLGLTTKCAVIEELRHSIIPFVLPPESPNLHLLQQLCRGAQIDDYLMPFSRGELRSCLALSEPGAGSDAGAIRTRATRRDGKWFINGEKTWISYANKANFMVVIARAMDGDKELGITAFLVDMGAPGVTLSAPIPVIADHYPYSIFFDDVRVEDGQVLGEIGQAFAPLKRRLGVRRVDIAARCVGLAKRCLEMMIEHANRRSTFGQRLADRQAVQWMIADSYQEMEMVRLLVYKLAAEIDQQASDIRIEGAMVKVQATEMIGRVVDRAIQLLGGMGLTKELPLEYMYRLVRIWRIVEGPSEIHRWTIGRDLLKNGLPDH